MKKTTLFIDLNLGQSLHIGDTRVSLVKKHGQASHLRIDAPAGVNIRRPQNPNPGALECASSSPEDKELTWPTPCTTRPASAF